MKRWQSVAVVLALLVSMMSGITAYGADGYTPNPQTPYAQSFVAKSEGQQWFLQEVERLLNTEQKTIDTLASAADLQNIKALGLHGRGIAGKIPPAIGELTGLEHLFLSGNKLEGTIPAELFGLPRLQTIDLSENLYQGPVPEGFGTMAALTSLTLKSNEFSGTIPPSILNNAQLTILNVKDNKLTGCIPAELNNMTGLEYLNLSENALGGPVPQLGNLQNLVGLSLWRCGATGPIPNSLYTLPKLQVLDLAENGLTGTISQDIGNLSELQHCTLDNNKLEGGIPAELGTLTKLIKLNLANNKLRGTIPDVFTMNTLTELRLEQNYLRGTVPASVKARLDAKALVTVTNNYLTGTVLAGMQYNAANFADGAATEQYQLTSRQSTVQVYKDRGVNLYTMLQNQSKLSGNTTQKILLKPEEYTIDYDNTKVELTVDATGIHAKALDDIVGSGTAVTIAIKDNTGSNYSKTTLRLTTETVSMGGGGGGAPTPVAKEHPSYITGYPGGQFGPADPVTRQEIAKMLVTALELTPRKPAVSSYTDVSADSWAFGFIEEATERGYLQGYGGGRFGPQNAISRGELAACLVRIAEKSGKVPQLTPPEFTDVSADKWYSSYVVKAAQYGLVNGYTDGTFRPEETVRRDEAVTMINRMLGREPDKNQLQGLSVPFGDIAPTDWAYYQILEAAVSHKHMQ